MTTPLRGISSMATRQILSDLAQDYARLAGQAVTVESVGGVDALRRVQAGEAFDWVALASEAIERLIASGHVLPGSRVDIATSPVAVAVRAGAGRPDVATPDALRQAVLTARNVGYSTGPSGTHLERLFEQWGISDQLEGRLVQAPPGVPVGTLVARGEVELGFQQLGELMHLRGVEVLGTLPAAVACITTFSAGVCAGTAQADAARRLLDYMSSPASAAAKQRHGMEAA